MPERPPVERPVPKPPVQAPKPADVGDDVFTAAENFYRQKQYDKALDTYTAYLNRYPNGSWVADSLLKIGLIHREKGRLAQALSSFQKLSLDFPNSALAAEAEVASFPIYYQMKNYGGVIQRATSLLKQRLAPDIYRQTVDWLAQAYFASGRSADALLVYAQAMGNVDATTQLAFRKNVEAMAAKTDPDELMRLVNRISQQEIQGEIVCFAATGYYQKEDYDKALAAIDLFRRDYPQHPKRAQIDALGLQIKQQAEYAKHTIGCILPLSGTYEAYGKRALRGIEMAQYVFGTTRASEPITVLVKDSQSTPEGSAAAVRELADAKVAAILGPIGSADSAAETAQSLGIPILTLTQKERITQIGNQVFRHFITPEMQAEKLVSYAVISKGLKRFAVLYPKESYGTGMMNAFWDKVLAAGGTMVGAEGYDPASADFGLPIQKLTGAFFQGQASGTPPNADIDALFIPESPARVSQILPQLVYYNLKPRLILGTNLWHTPAMMPLAGGLDAELVCTDAFDPDIETAPVPEFVKLCMETYNEKPGLIEAITYDSASILFETVLRPDIRYRSDIRRQLLAMQPRMGVTGKTRFLPDRDCKKELLIFRIQPDRFLDMTGF
jgi:ABC-type branched-subunit amino acid transport system substrate-binding protein